jgi:hypothetical protein
LLAAELFVMEAYPSASRDELSKFRAVDDGDMAAVRVGGLSINDLRDLVVPLGGRIVN